MFKENELNGCVYMTSSKINARHMFTTRIGGVSSGVYSSWNLGINRGDDPGALRENYALAGEIMGCGTDDFVVTTQVHGTEVRVASESDRQIIGAERGFEADGLVTNIKGLPLMIYIADCVPVLLCDEAAQVIAAVHCGWKSSVADILGVAVGKMQTLGAHAEDIKAAIGASIGRCCFECDDDVPEAVSRYLGGDTEGLLTLNPTARPMSTCAEPTCAVSCSLASRPKMLTFPRNAPCVCRINTGRTARPTACAEAWRRR